MLHVLTTTILAIMNFDPNEEIILENTRVRLRPLQMEDLPELLPFSVYEPDLWTYSLLPANGEENLRTYMQLAMDKRKTGDSYPFLVFDKESNQIAGSTRFYDVQRDHDTVQLGYTWYGKRFHGTGLNKQCKFLMLNHAFDVMQVERVEFRADANNARSIAAMKSIGCQVEGILRSNCTSTSGRRDSIILSILKNEWYGSVKAQLQSKL